MASTPPGLEGNWPHPGMNREELAFLGSRSSRKEIGMTAIGGSCLCGGVKFEITGPLSSPLNCHLFTMSQAAWRAVPQPRSGAGRRLPLVQGEHLIKYYESAGGYLRFCRECRSPIINRTGPNWKRAAQFPAQCLNTASRWPFWTIHRCGRHATSSSASKAPWFEITDDLPQYAEYAPPG